ncbi:hypothetical protein EVAR_52692_1 [Eumeta japonica]|uniref:Uncharacterized protein n=1 Tax=Eumeta variegata TaxID=151549 RepID=A0A4C1Y1N5_EUMVA|nr:hypothetical protein EVAR_52692_1 [Eumeta japonica]
MSAAEKGIVIPEAFLNHKIPLSKTVLRRVLEIPEGAPQATSERKGSRRLDTYPPHSPRAARGLSTTVVTDAVKEAVTDGLTWYSRREACSLDCH